MRIAVYHGSREIYPDMVSASKSLLTHTKVDKVYFLIEDDVFPFPLPSVIETRNVRGLVPQYFRPDGPNYNSQWTPTGMIRYALTKVFPEYDKVLSIDADTIVMEDIGELWDLPLDGYYFAAAREPILSQHLRILYTNAGVLMLNLKKLREDRKDDEIISALNKRHFFFVGQDAINFCCQGGILEIPSDYNASNFTLPSENKKVLHFAGDREWIKGELATQYREMPWPMN